ncbi:Arginine--tRNA ligase [Arsenophonus endosymbiont of Aleurodicus dispersus]|uniref:arginine--tRNA ligase n=1 Tax=Arsenophonus endosymbiont of Aleurodicus dispersus TaxID=235559 RepID=UPI000EAC5031|nr:arginine--tRNA ligase [Arsenophonus endosymbiont of Aleurodicus dispersus]VAY02272.1 Arginine--tRNA ligase [Arsenophonus endosymbiont of Aleurodicus dispersus]
MNILALLSEKIINALVAAGAPKCSEAHIRSSIKSKFGDYQANGIMSAAKKIGIPPLQLAEKMLPLLNLENIASKVEISGPGFINIFLDKQWIAKQIEFNFQNKKLAISDVTPQTIIIDYSAPNVAKQMHVGHLRSTIIGDAVARTLNFLGHKVIRANHIGDWGTQFGMLIAYLEKVKYKNTNDITLADLEAFYRKAQKNYDEDEKFAEVARNYVVKLQSGDEFCRKMWRKLVDITMAQNQRIYHRLNVTLTEDDVMGESLYNDMLPNIVADLTAKGLAVESDGAIVVYLDEFKNKDGDIMGVIIQKKDGGYLYTTTDIACAKYRHEILHADRVLYYIDSRQHKHLMHAWAIVRKAGYIPATMSLEHHMLGMMLGKDGKPFRTRSGETIQLDDLLDEAIERAGALIRQKNPDMPEKELQSISKVVGIGAIKYADLSKNRTTDYIFDWDSMLTFDGNTAPYMQYAYARVASILKRANINPTALSELVILENEYEQSLAIRLLQFEETILTVANEGLPYIMCAYLYDLAKLFSSFYEHCPILVTKNIASKESRLKLALLTQKTLKIGLDILGIETVERM